MDIQKINKINTPKISIGLKWPYAIVMTFVKLIY